MDEWITKAEILEMGMTEGQFKWRVLTGDIKRHPESRRLYRRYDVERLVKAGRFAQKPFECSAAPRRRRTKTLSADDIAKINRLRACLALKICAKIAECDTKLGRQVGGLFRISPERILETARQFR